jgi:hypothetical protein
VDPDESEVIAHIFEHLRQSGLTSRCAWCGRYRAGERWFRLDRPPSFIEMGELSHGICPDCIAELQGQGRSV